MLFLIPYRHESLSVRRLPWITFALIFINVIVYLITFLTGPNVSDRVELQSRFLEYYQKHPYLKISPELEARLSESARRDYQKLRASANTENLSEEQIQNEQAELDQIMDEMQKQLEENPINKYGHKPAEPYLWSFFTGMFLHAGLLHLLGNMLFLYLAGCSIEDVWGRPLYLCFYLSAGILAMVMHDLRFPDSEVAVVGASGAIAGLMGAFMIRLYNTRISFFYLIFLVRGTFQLPAWVVLPFWLFQQLILSSFIGTNANVAFLAHIGGFIFGAIFAFVLGLIRFEEKFISSYIERQVGIAQNPLFLQAMELSQKLEFVKATDLLKQVIQQEPDHFEAYMELRRIAGMIQDSESYDRYTGSMMESLIRKKQYDLVMDTYRQALTERTRLPSRTILALGSYLEEIPDFRMALDVYQKLVDQGPVDVMAVKAYSRMARLCIEKFGDRKQGIEWLTRGYLSTKQEEWRSMLKAEFKKYGLPLPAIDSAPVPVPAPPVAPVRQQAVEFHELFSEEPMELELPSEGFDGSKRGWNPVSCQLENVEEDGITLRNQQDMLGVLKWTTIHQVSVGRIRVLQPGEQKAQQDFLVLDLIPRSYSNDQNRVLYRMNSQQMQLKKLFPEQKTLLEAYRKLARMILDKTAAEPIPSDDRCMGPSFEIFPGVIQYDSQLRSRILKRD